jgi:hypothetical protein
LDYTAGIAISDALGGFEPTNHRIESLEDERGFIPYRLGDKSSGTGTRQSGEKLRNEILNISREASGIIVLNFDGIAVVSSSFADEFVGKLVAHFGFTGFVRRFRLVHMNNAVEGIVNRSVSQRMGETVRRGRDD